MVVECASPVRQGAAGGAEVSSMHFMVDVLLATFNGAKYLAQQLDSILAQTHQNFRLLVSDDGSSDDTLAILESYRPRLGERLLILPYAGRGRGVVRNFENLMCASRQHGVARWAAFADQDDVWLPQKLEVLVNEMVRLENASGGSEPCLVHSDLAVVDQELQTIARSFVDHQRMDPAQCTPLALLSVNQVTGCAMMVNRALLELALPLPPQAVMHDWWCALLSGSGQRSYVNSQLLLYRQHGANQVGAKSRSLAARLVRLATRGSEVLTRVRALGEATRDQASALRHRLEERGCDGVYVSKYLEWRGQPLWLRIAGYRRFYVGPELDRLSRCLLWFK
jgi:glycosyltransferase involved in cell wall biosynthesis